MKKGLLIVNTRNGKGKTTAARGLLLRAGASYWTAVAFGLG